MLFVYRNCEFTGDYLYDASFDNHSFEDCPHFDWFDGIHQFIYVGF